MFSTNYFQNPVYSAKMQEKMCPQKTKLRKKRSFCYAYKSKNISPFCASVIGYAPQW